MIPCSSRGSVRILQVGQSMEDSELCPTGSIRSPAAPPHCFAWRLAHPQVDCHRFASLSESSQFFTTRCPTVKPPGGARMPSTLHSPSECLPHLPDRTGNAQAECLHGYISAVMSSNHALAEEGRSHGEFIPGNCCACRSTWA